MIFRTNLTPVGNWYLLDPDDTDGAIGPPCDLKTGSFETVFPAFLVLGIEGSGLVIPYFISATNVTLLFSQKCCIQKIINQIILLILEHSRFFL